MAYFHLCKRPFIIKKLVILIGAERMKISNLVVGSFAAIGVVTVLITAGFGAYLYLKNHRAGQPGTQLSAASGPSNVKEEIAEETIAIDVSTNAGGDGSWMRR